MLKFGQVVDLNLMEKTAPSKFVQDLQDKVEDQEHDHRKLLRSWEDKIKQAQKDLADTTKENTVYMEQISNMGSSQLQLDQSLNARIANVTVNDAEPTAEL